jgi:DNA-binding response OmpR family regulator
MTSVARSHQLPGVRTLVVEDDADLRDVIEQCLRMEGADVSSAEVGNLGFDVFVRERPDVIVSDLWMADGSGFDFVERVRKLPAEHGGLTPAIAISAAENRRSALMAGFQAFVGKPFDPFALVEVIAGFVRSSHGQKHAPWTLSVIEPGKLLVTFVGCVGGDDVRAMTSALLNHLEEGPLEIIVDLRRLTLFYPSAATIAERALWIHRRRIRAARIIGGSLSARLVALAATRMLCIPCTLSPAADEGGPPSA